MARVSGNCVCHLSTGQATISGKSHKVLLSNKHKLRNSESFERFRKKSLLFVFHSFTIQSISVCPCLTLLLGSISPMCLDELQIVNFSIAKLHVFVVHIYCLLILWSLKGVLLGGLRPITCTLRKKMMKREIFMYSLDQNLSKKNV